MNGLSMDKRGAFSIFRGSKRGLSPLIATVLLIAFAVAMGAMIMNWSSTIGEGLNSPDCSGIKLLMSPAICYKENVIKINLRNQGGVVEELKLKISDDNSVNEVALKNSKLRLGDEVHKDISYSMTGKTSVEVIPSVNHNGKVTPCATPAIQVSDLKECSN
jgi:flagellin-like protein